TRALFSGKKEQGGPMKNQSQLFLVLRLAIGALFVYSGWDKLMEPGSNFMAAILGYRMVDVRTASWLAAALPWAELITGVFFMLGIWLRPSLFVLWGLNGMFLTAIFSAFIRRIPIQNCGCFGEGAQGLPIQATLMLDV